MQMVLNETWWAQRKRKKKWLEIIILHAQNWMRSECWRTHPEAKLRVQNIRFCAISFDNVDKASLPAFQCHQRCIYNTGLHAQFQFVTCIWAVEPYLLCTLTPASTLLTLGTTCRHGCDFGHQHGKENKPHCSTSKVNIILQRMRVSSSCRPRAAAGKESVEIIIKASVRAPWMKWLSSVICWILSAQCQRKQQLST